MSTFSLARLDLPPASSDRPFGLGILPIEEAEVHHGDDFCSDCDAYHSPLDPPLTAQDMGFRAAFYGLSRDDAPTGPARRAWIEGFDQLARERAAKPVHMAPDSFASPAERQRAADRTSAIVGAGDARRAARNRPFPSSVDLAFSAGMSIALDVDGAVEAPSHYTTAERDAFLRGLNEGSVIAHEREQVYLDEIALRAEVDAETACAANFYGVD